MSAPAAPGGRRAALLAALVYGALALGTQRGLVAGLRDHVYHQALPGNDCLLHAWTLAWDQHALATDALRLPDANIFYPYARTLLYSDHLLGLAVLLAPLRLLTDNAVLVHNVATLAAPALDALALYALAWELTASPMAAFVGGLLYGFAPTRLVIDRCQIQMLAAWWLPLVFLFARRAVATDRAGAGLVAGLVLAFQGLTGIYLTAFLAPFLLLAELVWLVRFPPWRHPRGWAGLAAGQALALLAVLPFALGYRQVQQDLGVSRSIVLNALLSLQPSALFTHVPAVLLLLAAAGAVARGLPEALRGERPLLIAIALGAVGFALGPAATLPGGHGYVWGPYAALLGVPGFDALRAPGRFIHLALLAGALLAAGGVALLMRLPRLGRVIALAVVLGAFAAEAGAPSFPLIVARPPREANPVYGWLAEQPPDFRFVELPIDDYGQAASAYQHASTAHWQQMPSGNMGITPPLYPWLVRKLRRFPDSDVLGVLRTLDVDKAVLHLPGRMPPALARLGTERRSPLERLHAERFTLVLGIRPGAPPAPRKLAGKPLARTGWTVTASHGTPPPDAAMDADPTTSWSSWGALEHALTSRWYDDTPFMARWREFLASQPARLEVDLGARRNVTGVALRLGGSDPMAAPMMVVETSGDGEAWTPAPGEIDPVPDARALVTHAAEQRFALAFPRPVRARFVRLSVVGLEWRVGDLQVHAQ